MPICFKNGSNELKYPKWKSILGVNSSPNIEILSFLFPLINVCIKLIFNTQCERGLCGFLFSIRRRQQSCRFWIFFLSFLVLWHFDKDYTDFGFFFFHLEFEFKNPDFIYFLLGFACVDFSICIIIFIFFSLENPLSNDNSNNKNDKGCVDISRA